MKSSNVYVSGVLAGGPYLAVALFVCAPPTPKRSLPPHQQVVTGSRTKWPNASSPVLPARIRYNRPDPASGTSNGCLEYDSLVENELCWFVKWIPLCLFSYAVMFELEHCTVP